MFSIIEKFQSIKESNQFQSSSDSGLRLILSDFNYDVLRLVTVPNLLIHWASTISIEQLHELTSTTNDDGGGGDKIESKFVNDEILITTKLIDQFKMILIIIILNYNLYQDHGVMNLLIYRLLKIKILMVLILML